MAALQPATAIASLLHVISWPVSFDHMWGPTSAYTSSMPTSLHGEARLTSLSFPQELLFAQKDGVPVIDIRPPPEFDAGHIEGSINVPLYRLITGVPTERFCRHPCSS